MKKVYLIAVVFALIAGFATYMFASETNKKTTIKEYFKENSVLNSIPVNSIVYLKDGKIVSGEDFLKDLYKYIDKYQNFVELRNSLINLIEYK